MCVSPMQLGIESLMDILQHLMEDESRHSTWGLVGPLSSGQADQLAPITSIGNGGVMLVCQFHNNLFTLDWLRKNIIVM